MEDIDELRAKVIASMASGGNPNSKRMRKSLSPREEGELSDDDEEVPACSDVNTTTDRLAVSALPNFKSEKRKRWRSGDVVQTSCFPSSLAGIQQRTSTSANYRKRIKRLSNKSHVPAWHRHSDSNDNLIISFSEGDDTDSNSEESDSEGTGKDTVGGHKVDRCRRLLQTSSDSSLQHQILEKRSNNQMKLLPTRMNVGHPSVAKGQSVYPRMLGLSGCPTVGKETSIHRHAPTNKVSLKQELGPISDVNMADDKVRSLRQQIAVRENELRLQKRSIPESKDRIVYSDKDCHVNSMKPGAEAFRADSPLSNLPSSEESKHLKPDEHLCSEASSDGLSPVRGPGMKSISETEMGALEASVHPELATETHHLTNGTVLEKNVAEIYERHGGSNSSLHVSSVMFPLQVKDKEYLMTSNQTDTSPYENRVLSPVKPSSLQDMNFVNDSSHLQLQGQIKINREVILNWEALNDKELEEAQEIRRKCELEEMRALKAYRKAREALAAANNRCSVLYRRREELSLLASRCLSHREVVPKANNELLSELNHLADAEEQSLDQVGYNLQTSGDGLRADQYCKDDVNVRNPENVITHSRLPNVLMNGGQGFLIDNELPQSRTVCQTDEANVSGETVAIDVETERSPVQHVHDFELEASLRSKLVARFSVKSTSKSIPGTCSSNIAQESEMNANNAQSNAHMWIVNQQVQEGEKIVEGASNSSTTPLQDSSCLKESCVPKQITAFSKPSVLQTVCRHFKLLCPEASVFLHKEVIDVNFTNPDREREHIICSSSLATLPCNNGDLAIDPFWPLCMFELRGKCNDEECPWQHLKECNQRKSKLTDSASSSSDKQVDSSENLVKVNDFHRSPHGIQHNIMSVPTYRIGSILIKSDAQVSQSVLARGMWPYWQVGFCTSFPLPFSVQRILPPEAQFSLASDIHLTDNDNWNRPSLYFPSEDYTLKQSKQCRSDSEQTLDRALDCFIRKNNNMDVTRKVLKALSRALEGDRNSVVFWIVYLQLYYRKEKHVGKDDMFFHAENDLGTTSLGILYLSFTVFSLVASPMVRFLGSKNALVLGTSGYMLFIASNLKPSWYTMVPASLYLGYTASIIWVGQGTYLTSAARSHARDCHLHEGTVIGNFNGEFWGMFASTQVIGNLVSLALLGGGKDGESFTGVTPLFTIFLASMIMGTILMCFLCKRDDREECLSKPSTDVYSAAKSLMQSVIAPLLDKRMLLIIPLLAYSGLQQAYVWSEFTKHIITPALGVSGVGGAMAIFGFSDAVCSLVAGRFTSGISSITLIISGGAFLQIFVLLWLLLKYSLTSGVLGYVYPLLMAAIWGIGDGVFNTQLNALLGMLFTNHTEAAFAQLKVWQSASTALVFFLSPHVTFQAMSLLLVIVLLVSVLGFLLLTLHVENAFGLRH